MPPAPGRTPQEALQLATSLAAKLRAQPDLFPGFAREYSEDVTTAPFGGSLGGVTASRLSNTPEVLDALAAMKPDEVSGVVDTGEGFEILLRRHPPPLDTIAARRLLVPYDARASASDAGPPSQGRSRADALSIAQTAAAELRRDIGAFDRLLAQYPPSQATESDGFIGVWTNQEPGAFEREREQIALLQPGGVTDPIDSPEGFQVFLRIPVPPVQEYATQVIQFGYAGSGAAPNSESRDAALKDAQSVAHLATIAPGRFDELQRQHWTPDARRWRRGRSPHDVFEAVAKLPLGGITRSPLEYDSSFIVLKRTDLDSAPAPTVLFELPSPAEPDIRRIVRSSSGPAVQKFIRKLGDEGSKLLGLAPPESVQFTALHERLAAAFAIEESSVSRARAYTAFDGDLHQMLSEDQYRQYRQLLGSEVTQKVMDMR